MKAAILNANIKFDAGASIATKRIQDVLLKNGIECDLLNFVKEGLRNKAQFKFVNKSDDNAEIEDWSQYKYFIIADTGYDLTCGDFGLKFVDEIAKHTHTVDLWAHDEYVAVTDAERFDRFFDYFKSKILIGTLYGITPQIAKKFVSRFLLSHRDLGHLPGSGYFKYKELGFEQKKSGIVGYAGRIVSRKKITQFIQMMGLLKDRWIPELWGASAPGIFNVKLLQVVKDGGWVWDDSSIYKGRYPMGEFPPDMYRYTWNCVMIGKGYKQQFIPRIELATIESYESGCLPILLKESVPEWMPEDLYIPLDWTAIRSTAKWMPWSKKAGLLEEQLLKIDKMYDEGRQEEIAEKCRKALKLIDENWPVTKSYEAWTARVRSIVK